MEWFDAPGSWLSRLVFLRGLAAVYLVAFVAAANQFRPLLGECGILPIPRYVAAVPFRRAPSVFHIAYSDRLFAALAWGGALLSGVLLAGLADLGPVWLAMLLWAIPWALYQSIVNVGQVWYGFGWETLLLEAGFLAIFLGPSDVAPPLLVLLLLRWLLLRVELGAGLIKIRGDRCWRDLTCLYFHHETQPLPGPLSHWFHHFPAWFHRLEVLGNHFAQLIAPWFLLAPQPVAGAAAIVIVATQLWLVASGNFSWLNVLTIVIALPSLDDFLLGRILPVSAPATLDPSPDWYRVTVLLMVALVAVLSVRPALNLLSPRQRMNSSFDPLHLVNTYGAFGSITRVRREIVLEGTTAQVLDPDTSWRPYELKAKPGNPTRRPRQVAPYHLRLDWLMWFAALSPGYAEPWFGGLVDRLLRGDPRTLALFAADPFSGTAPTHVRARLYEYRFSTAAERRETGAWWQRELLGDYLPAVRGAGA